MNIAAWITAVVIFDAPLAAAGLWYGRRRHRHLAIRHRIAHYSHLGG